MKTIAIREIAAIQRLSYLTTLRRRYFRYFKCHLGGVLFEYIVESMVLL